MAVRTSLWRQGLLSLVLAAALGPSLARPAVAAGYKQTNLVKDPGAPVSAIRTDPNLINPWGLTSSPTGPWWIANTETASASVYNGNGDPVAPFGIMTPPGATGIIYN